jgi:predicted metal-dependent hydrolase
MSHPYKIPIENDESVKQKRHSAELPECPGVDKRMRKYRKDIQKQLQFEQDKKELLQDPYFCSWSEKEVGEFLIQRLHDLSDYYQLPYRSASISFDKKIWGSCSGSHHIIINFNVALLPERLRDYLFLHELVHTKIPNHEEEFWQELDRYTKGKAKQLKKELDCHKMKLAH